MPVFTPHSSAIPQLTSLRREFFLAPTRKLIFVPLPKFLAEPKKPSQELLLLGTKLVRNQEPDSVDDEDDDDDEIKNGFWRSIDQVLWNGPRYFRVNMSLSTLYPGNEHLFKNILDVSKVKLHHFLAECRAFTETDSRDYMSKIITATDKYISRNYRDWYDYRQELQSQKIWPVSSESWNPSKQLRSALDSKDYWFIADRPHWRDVFGKVVPILDFDVDHQRNMEHIFSEFGFCSRFISVASKTIPSFEGVEPSPQYTERFRSKYGFFAR